MNLDHFGMDTITLAGPLEAKLKAQAEALKNKRAKLKQQASTTK